MDGRGAPRKRRNPVIRQVPAVSRAVAILRTLARSDAPVGVVQLANTLGMIPSTCLHIVRVLNSEGLISADPNTKKYQLGAGVLALANEFVSRNSLVQVVRPHLDDLSRRHSCTTVAVEPSGPDHFIVIAASSVDQSISVRVRVGTRFPAMISATGRCLAAFGDWSAAELRERFGELRWQNPPDLDTWLGEVELTRRRGYAVDAGNYIRGITIVAAPILSGTAGITGALVSLRVSDQLTKPALAVLAGDLQGAATLVGGQLGHAGGPVPAAVPTPRPEPKKRGAHASA